jgi:hypothetical protein
MIKLKREPMYESLDFKLQGDLTGQLSNLSVKALSHDMRPFYVIGDDVHPTMGRSFELMYSKGVDGKPNKRKISLSELLENEIMIYDSHMDGENDSYISLQTFFNSGIGINRNDMERRDIIPITIFINKSLIKFLDKYYPEEKFQLLKDTFIRKINVRLLNNRNSKMVYDNYEAFYSYFNTVRPDILNKILNDDCGFGQIIGLLIFDFKYRGLTPGYKRFLDSLFNLMADANLYPPTYLISGLERLVTRFNSEYSFGLGTALAINTLEKMSTAQMSNQSLYTDNRVEPWNKFEGANRYNISLFNLVYRQEVNNLYRPSPLTSVGENFLVGGQAIGNYITDVVSEPPAVVENPESGLLINNDNLKVFLYKDIALSLENIKNRIEAIDTEDTRQALLNECRELQKKCMDSRVRINMHKNGGINEFDGLEEEINNISFDIANFDIYTPQDIAISESLGIPVVGYGEYLSFGEINPYNVADKVNGKDNSIGAMSNLKETSKTVYVKFESTIAKMIKGLFLNITALAEEGVINVWRDGGKFIYGLRTIIGLGFPHLYPMSPIERGLNKFNSATFGSGKRAISYMRKARKRSNDRHEKWRDLLTGYESLPVTLDKGLQFTELKINIDLKASGEANILQGIMSGVQQLNAGVLKIIGAKIMKKLNQAIAKQKKMDRASYDKLSAINADIMEKSKKANPKEREWMRKNLLLNLKGVEVVETKAGKK